MFRHFNKVGNGVGTGFHIWIKQNFINGPRTNIVKILDKFDHVGCVFAPVLASPSLIYKFRPLYVPEEQMVNVCNLLSDFFGWPNIKLEIEKVPI